MLCAYLAAPCKLRTDWQSPYSICANWKATSDICADGGAPSCRRTDWQDASDICADWEAP